MTRREKLMFAAPLALGVLAPCLGFLIVAMVWGERTFLGAIKLFFAHLDGPLRLGAVLCCCQIPWGALLALLAYKKYFREADSRELFPLFIGGVIGVAPMMISGYMGQWIEYFNQIAVTPRYVLPGYSGFLVLNGVYCVGAMFLGIAITIMYLSFQKETRD